jgi:hypothetical protein
MTTEVNTSAIPLLPPIPARRGRKPGSKNKPKVKAKPVHNGGRKPGQKYDLPRTARAYLRQTMNLKFPTESEAIAELIVIDARVHRDYDNLWKSVELMAEAEEVKLSGIRQFFVNMFAGQPVKVSPL